MLAFALVLLWHRRQGPAARSGREARETHMDSDFSWTPTAARVLTVTERRAMATLQQALPGFLVLAQVPIARFLRVPPRQSQREWLRRIGHINADLLLCDGGSQVRAVIDIRPPLPTIGSERRHERMVRMLKSAGITTVVWSEDALPGPTEARTMLLPVLTGSFRDGSSLARATALTAHPSGGASPSATTAMPVTPSVHAAQSMSMIPVPEISELLEDGDAAFDAAMEPVPSAMFDDLEPLPGQRPH
ncbi:MAG: DUF2726 domain-containing protein [Aquabacterium sp.]